MPADQFALKLAASLPIVGSLYDGEEKMLGGIEDLIGGTLRWAGASEKVSLRWSSTATQIAYAKNQFEGLDRMHGIMQPFNNAAASSFERIRLANAKPGDDTQQTQMEIRFAEEQRKLKAMRNRMADLQRKADTSNYIATPAERDELAACGSTCRKWKERPPRRNMRRCTAWRGTTTGRWKRSRPTTAAA